MITYCIPTYNRLPYLKQCLESFIQGFRNYPYEIIVADGGSTDGTLEYLRYLDNENIQIIEQGKLIGITKSYNQIFKIAKGDYICPGNDDAIAIPEVLIKACQLMEEDQQIGLIAPKLQEPSFRNLHGVTRSRIKKYWVLLSKFFMLRADVLKKINYLDESFRSYFIDDDSFLSVMNLGYSTIFTKEVAFIHYRVQDQDTNVAKAINYDRIESEKQLNYLYKKWEKLELNLKEYLRNLPHKKMRAIFFTALCDKMYYSDSLKNLVEKNTEFSMKLFDLFLQQAVVFKDKKYDNLKDFFLAQKYPDEIIEGTG